mmetsp:Transcript_72099/g.233233  ORF Transcript_72099/g.233233 Transcript_72099/m.233233 type:complete len:212 (+) Transcript_72099:869-1504(+)
MGRGQAAGGAWPACLPCGLLCALGHARAPELRAGAVPGGLPLHLPRARLAGAEQLHPHDHPLREVHVAGPRLLRLHLADLHAELPPEPPAPVLHLLADAAGAPGPRGGAAAGRQRAEGQAPAHAEQALAGGDAQEQPGAEGPAAPQVGEGAPVAHRALGRPAGGVPRGPGAGGAAEDGEAASQDDRLGQRGGGGGRRAAAPLRPRRANSCK